MFSHANLVLFDKKGNFFPLTQKSEIIVIINDDFGGSAIFYPIIGKNNANQNEIIEYKKINGGRFINNSATKQCIVKYAGNSFKTSVNVEIEQVPATADNTIYTISNIRVEDNPEGFNIPSENLPFPSFSVSQKLLFNKVSVALHETEYFYVLAEVKDTSGNIEYKEVNEILSEDETLNPNIEGAKNWAQRYKLLFFIDCRDQDNFRTFKVNGSDEVIWSDRTIIDFTTTETPRVNLGFRGDNEGVYEQVLYICLMDTQTPDIDTMGCDIIPIGEISMIAEAIGEDERYRTLFENFGIPDPKDFDHVYKDSYTEDDKPDYISINNHSKEMFLSYDKIFPYIGTYKALFNAVKLLGYNDIFFKEWYKIMGISNEISRGYVAYNMAYKSNGIKDVISALPLEKRLNLHKKNWISMVYNINKELYGAPDEYNFPYVENVYEYRSEDSLIKLISLREWLEKYVMALNCRIIDICGEGIYFERYNYSGYSTYQQNLSFDAEINVIPKVADDFLKDKFLLKDCSSYIPVRVIANSEEQTFNDFKDKRFADYCEGYIDSRNDEYLYHIYSDDIESLPEDSSSVYVGTTFMGYNGRLMYKLDAVSTVKDFIFDKSYFADDSPRLIVQDNAISFIAPDLLTKEKNSAFKKLPVISLERAIIRTFNDSWEKHIDFTIYPENDPSTGVSYFIENKTNGKKEGSSDYIFLAPPNFTETDTDVTIITRNEDASCTHSKRKHYNYTSDFGTVLQEYTTDDTTYGLRFSANNAYEMPLFSIQGYTVKKPVDFEIPVSKEYYIDIIKGKLIFNDPEHKRKIYLIFDTDEKGKRTIDVKIAYSTEEFDICEYVDTSSNFPYFIENNEYKSFADNYNETNNPIIYNLNHDIKVYNSGIFNVALTVRDIYGQVYCVNTANKAEILTEDPSIIAFTNNNNSGNEYNKKGKYTDNEVLKNAYEEFCIFEYKPKNDIINVEIDNNIISYPVYPYNNSAINDKDIAHYMNLNDKFKIVAYDAFIQHEDKIDWNYYLILNRQNRKPYTRIVESNDVSTIADMYDGFDSVPTRCKDLLADTNGSENLDVTVMFYNEAGAFPIIQVPGKIVNAKVLDNINNTSNYYSDEYHLLISNDITDCYYYEATDNYGNVLSITKDDIYYTAITFEQDNITWLLKSALSEGYGSLWEYDTLPTYIASENVLNKKYAYSNAHLPIDALEVYDITTDGWEIKEAEDNPWIKGWMTHNGSPDFIHNIDETASVSWRIAAGNINDNEEIDDIDIHNMDTSIRYRVYSDSAIYNENNETVNNGSYVFNTYYAIKPKLLMDYIPEIITNPNIGIYIYPYWKDAVRIIGVDPENSRVIVQFPKDLYPRAFKKGETVKMIWGTEGTDEATTQSSYKVIGYDAVGLALVLEGLIPTRYVLTKEKTYAYADIPEELASRFDITEEGWIPQETEDGGWIKGWLTYNGSPWFTYHFDPLNSYCNPSDLPENSVAHDHQYRIPAGYYVKDDNTTVIRYRVFTHDDLHCTDTECEAYEHGMFSPYYYSYAKNDMINVYLSYAHNAYSDYKMTVKSSEIKNVKNVELSHDKNYINDKLTYYIDDTFKVVTRSFDTDNGITYWMNSSDGVPTICDSSIYSYKCPVSIYGKSSNIAFFVDSKEFSDINNQTVLWKVLKSIDANTKTLLFESWNNALFLDIEDKGIYDIELNVFDNFGNKSKHLFEGAYTILNIEENEPEYNVTCESILMHGSGDYGYITGGNDIFKNGDNCMLRAYVNEGYVFDGWYIDNVKISSDKNIMFTVNTDYNITARFDTILFMITAIPNSDIMGDVSILNGVYENGEYIGHYWGSECTIIATPKYYETHPDIPYRFVKWKDTDTQKTVTSDVIYSFTVNKDMNFTAMFEEALFTVNVNSNNINYGKTNGTALCNVGSSCIIEAVVKPNGIFIGWFENDLPLAPDPVSGSVYTDSIFTLTNISSNHNIIGKFKNDKPESCAIELYYITPDTSEIFTLTANPSVGAYSEQIVLNCNPISSGQYRFIGWYENTQGNLRLISTNSTATYTLRYANVNIGAKFGSNRFNIMATSNFSDYTTVEYTNTVTYNDSTDIILNHEPLLELVSYTINGIQGDMQDIDILSDYKYRLHLNNIVEDKNIAFTCAVKSDYIPFYIEAIEQGAINIKTVSPVSIELWKYAINNLETFYPLTDLPGATANNVSVTLNPGDRLYITAKEIITGPISSTHSSAAVFDSITCTYKVGGNLISLVKPFGTNYETAELLSNNIMANLFLNSTSLIDAKDLIMPRNNVNSCFRGLFRNTIITESPYLRAELKPYCYDYMFTDCHNCDTIYTGFKEWQPLSSRGGTVNWVNGVSVNGIFTKNSALIAPVFNDMLPYNGIPQNWTIVEENN